MSQSESNQVAKTSKTSKDVQPKPRVREATQTLDGRHARKIARDREYRLNKTTLLSRLKCMEEKIGNIEQLENDVDKLVQMKSEFGELDVVECDLRRLKQMQQEFNRLKQMQQEFNRLKQVEPEFHRLKQMEQEFSRLKQMEPEFHRLKQMEQEFNRLKQMEPEFHRLKQKEAGTLMPRANTIEPPNLEDAIGEQSNVLEEIPLAENASELHKWPMDQSSNYNTRLFEQKTLDFGLPNALEEFSDDVLNDQPAHKTLQSQLIDADSNSVKNPYCENDDMQMQSCWSAPECGNVSDDASLSPSISQDQLFSTVDFSPKGAYTDMADRASYSFASRLGIQLLNATYMRNHAEAGHQASTRFPMSTQIGNATVMDKMDPGFLNFLDSSHPFPGRSSIPAVDEVPNLHGDKPMDIDYDTCVTDGQTILDLASFEGGLEHYMPVYQGASSHASTFTQPETMSSSVQLENMMKGKVAAVDSASKDFGDPLPTQSNVQIPLAENAFELHKWPMGQSSNFKLAYDTRLFEQKTLDFSLPNTLEEFSSHDVLNEQLAHKNLQMQLINADSNSVIKPYPENNMHLGGNINYSFSREKILIEGEQSLKRVDSFSWWITKELGVDDLQMHSSSGAWSTVECGNVSVAASLSPSVSHDQLFSIVDFSPKWAYTDMKIKILIVGTFLKSQGELAKYNWSCMFGEVEVPAEIIAEGILSCNAPPHCVGQVPIYVTCSNRLACSEVREFDFRAGYTKDLNVLDIYGFASRGMLLRFEMLLSLNSFSPPKHHLEGVGKKRDLIAKIILMKEEEERHQIVDTPSDKDLSQREEKEYLLQKLLKEKLYSWLLHKIIEDGQGPNILDEKGQGILHFVAALGYDWAIKPTISAGVGINFRDANGWTALHWAASRGREQTVAILVSLGAVAEALTDPSPEFPLGSTPADLAFDNGHKGISCFLAMLKVQRLLSPYFHMFPLRT